MQPIVRVLAVRMLRATTFGCQPNRSMAAATFFLTSSATEGWALTTLETVPVDTPAARATSRAVTAERSVLSVSVMGAGLLLDKGMSNESVVTYENRSQYVRTITPYSVLFQNVV